MKLTITVDPDLCIGAASCVTIAPETFQLNDENKAIVLDHSTEPGGHNYQRIIEVTEDEKSGIIFGRAVMSDLGDHHRGRGGNATVPPRCNLCVI